MWDNINSEKYLHCSWRSIILFTSNRSSQSDNDLKRKKFRRPAQKLFDIDAIRAIGGEVTQDGDFLIFEGNRFTRKGYLYKTFAMSAIMADGVKPTLSELEKFEEQSLADMEVCGLQAVWVCLEVTF